MMSQTIEMICITIYRFNRIKYFFFFGSTIELYVLCVSACHSNYPQSKYRLFFFTIEVKDEQSLSVKMFKQYKSVQIRCHKHFISPYLQNNGKIMKECTFNSCIFLSMIFHHESVL